MKTSVKKKEMSIYPATNDCSMRPDTDTDVVLR